LAVPFVADDVAEDDMEFLGYGIDTLIFVGIAGVGFVLLVASFFAGSVFDFFQHDVDVSISDGGDAPSANSFVNTQGILGFMTGFGATGWICTAYLNIHPIVASAIGLAGGLAVMIPATLIYNGLQRQAGSSNYSEEDVVGTRALVSLTIPADGMGRIQFTKAGSINSGAAKSATGSVIKQGEQVLVERSVGGVFFVRKAE
jgi:hypothetical protein